MKKLLKFGQIKYGHCQLDDLNPNKHIYHLLGKIRKIHFWYQSKMPRSVGSVSAVHKPNKILVRLLQRENRFCETHQKNYLNRFSPRPLSGDPEVNKYIFICLCC